MSISEQVKELRKLADFHNTEIYLSYEQRNTISQAADTIESLSAKLADMGRQSANSAYIHGFCFMDGCNDSVAHAIYNPDRNCTQEVNPVEQYECQKISARNLENEDCTAQNIISMFEEQYIIAGARMFAREVAQLFEDKSDKSKSRRTVQNTLRFFAEKARTDELEAFIYGTHSGIVMKPVGKSKTEYQPIRVKPESSKKPVNPYEFISADEQRYRTLCQILLEVLMEAAAGIGLMSGRDANEVLNQFISKTNEKMGHTGWKILNK